MKKSQMKLQLNRETLRLLTDETLGQPLGGINPAQHTAPVPPTKNVCTATCPCGT